MQCKLQGLAVGRAHRDGPSGGSVSLPPRTAVRDLTLPNPGLAFTKQHYNFFLQDSDGDKSDDNLVVDVSNEVMILPTA